MNVFADASSSLISCWAIVSINSTLKNVTMYCLHTDILNKVHTCGYLCLVDGDSLVCVTESSILVWSKADLV